ncbi:ABC transporter permease subunit [Dokdonella sp.]|uniref:ABC transporter permease subunit n=1 Tax=Dokdonella sp. TaxID=2291710 RepID=UPI002638B3F3|nr:ABC transporter permease subunit [Dokdonella sp.]
MTPRRDTAGSWLIAGTAAIALAVLLGLLGLLLRAGLAPFWPSPIEEIRLRDGSVLLGEVVDAGTNAIALRTSEFDRIGGAYRRVVPADIVARTRPVDAILLELEDGRRLYARAGAEAPVAEAASPVRLRLQPNALGFFARIGAFAQSLGHFLAAAPVASNLAGGVLPALIGTVVLVLLMSVVAMPLGIATAIFLHERRGVGLRLVRGAINQLAGMPAIVYGVLGLGLFVHGIGAGIDRWFYADRLPVPTFGSGGLLWAALTLALLTLPVVVVSVEEGLARIPASLREGALALGATRDETLWTLLLPAVRPALLTGLVLAIARAAGAVAPLMLVGVVKLAPALPLDGTFPYLHPSQQFMHLGVTIYDAALASPDTIRGVPRAYACAALLVGVVVVLNLSAILLRNRLRDRYRALES